MSDIASKLTEIRARHDAVTGYYADEKGTAAHWDRDTLLRLAELLLGAQQYSDETRAALGGEIEAAEKRITELEKELQENQQSWQEHDQGRIFAAKAMQLRIAELEGVIYRNCDPTQATDSDAKIIDEVLLFAYSPT
jgi:hypothetical protein